MSGSRQSPRDKDNISAVELIALASTVSLLAGWRLYLVTFALGLARKIEWVALPDHLSTRLVFAARRALRRFLEPKPGAAG